jgi:hypothetical protein
MDKCETWSLWLSKWRCEECIMSVKATLFIFRYPVRILICIVCPDWLMYCLAKTVYKNETITATSFSDSPCTYNHPVFPWDILQNNPNVHTEIMNGLINEGEKIGLRQTQLRCRAIGRPASCLGVAGFNFWPWDRQFLLPSFVNFLRDRRQLPYHSLGG